MIETQITPTEILAIKMAKSAIIPPKRHNPKAWAELRVQRYKKDTGMVNFEKQK